ncbi:LamG-like jellyroll fold domain-containing protein [Saccharicrinis sp. FJH2]|uniref:LamG-like jellyroll fold domain-containing protein n=1 Tax=Saccharicrinis sp. FJH65 TaxID=3344659 RepID=UPI0035F386D3
MKKPLHFLMLLFLVSTAIGLAQTQEGLVGYWKFDEGTGTTVSDELGTTNGELVNAVEATWTDGYMGKALDFSQTDGNPAYARFAGDGVANIDGSLSMTMWVKTPMSPDGQTEYSIISKGVPYLTTGDIDGGWYHLSLKEGAIRFMLWDQDENFSSPGGDLPSDMTWDANTWYQIAIVRDKDNALMNVYLNGELISSDADGMQVSILNNEDLTFGSVANGVQTVAGPGGSSNPGNPFWDSNYLGSLDEVQLYNVALTDAQIKSIYDAYMTVGVDSKKIEKLSVTMNPYSNILLVNNAEKLTKVEIYSLTGQVVKTIKTSIAPSVSVNVSDLSKGTYIVKAYRTDYSVVASKFVKQ